jgi:hypothetical protein
VNRCQPFQNLVPASRAALRVPQSSFRPTALDYTCCILHRSEDPHNSPFYKTNGRPPQRNLLPFLINKITVLVVYCHVPGERHRHKNKKQAYTRSFLHVLLNRLLPLTARTLLAPTQPQPQVGVYAPALFNNSKREVPRTPGVGVGWCCLPFSLPVSLISLLAASGLMFGHVYVSFVTTAARPCCCGLASSDAAACRLATSYFTTLTAV